MSLKWEFSSSKFGGIHWLFTETPVQACVLPISSGPGFMCGYHTENLFMPETQLHKGIEQSYWFILSIPNYPCFLFSSLK